MKLNLKGFSQLVQDMGATLQSSGTTLVDISVGSVVRAIFEANASVVLWMQWLVLQVLQSTRAATSRGSDLDSWMLDFGQTRLPAVPSTGIVRFSRFSANLPAKIPLGTVVKTADGSLSFAVTEDADLSTWQHAASEYVLPSGVVSGELPVVCTVGGSVGNVLAGSIDVIASSLPGIDLVYNNSALTNGANSEDDSAFRNRFQNYLASLSKATLTAVLQATANVRQGLDIVIEENISASGAAQIGSFAVIVDDGTGYPSSDLLSSVASAVDSVRPVGTRFSVSAPRVQVVNVSLTASLTSGTATAEFSASIENHVRSYLNSLHIGHGASVTRIAQHAYLTENVDNITAIQLNGGLADIIGAPDAVIKAGQIVVTTHDG